MITTTRDPRRMIRDAAEFDRRQSGIRPFSEREMREALEMRTRLRRRDDRIISAFETSGTTPAPPASASFASPGSVQQDRWTPKQPNRTMVHDIVGGRNWADHHFSPGAGAAYTVAAASNVSYAVSAGPSGAGAYSDQTDATMGSCLRFGTAAGGGGGAAFYDPINSTRLTLARNPYFAYYFRLPSLTNVHFWFGFFDGNPGSVDSPAFQYTGFRYSNGVDTNWRCIQRDAGGTINNMDSGVVAGGNTAYLMEMLFDGTTGRMEYYLNGTLVADSLTNLPSTSLVFMSNTRNPAMYIGDKGAGGVSVDVSWIYLAWD